MVSIGSMLEDRWEISSRSAALRERVSVSKRRGEGVLSRDTSIVDARSLVPDDSPYVPGAFAWIKHEQLGRETGATPDGRKAGFPFADGFGPPSGRETRGLTAVVLSVTCWDHSPMLGGLAMNLKFNRALFDSAEGFQGLKQLIVTYLARGGFEAQVNVVDSQTLKDARAHPE